MTKNQFQCGIFLHYYLYIFLSCLSVLVHCGSIRQTATIIDMNKDCLRTGDKATVHFRFIKTPEYFHTDQRLVFREGRTKAVGTITKVRDHVFNSCKVVIYICYSLNVNRVNLEQTLGVAFYCKTPVCSFFWVYDSCFKQSLRPRCSLPRKPSNRWRDLAKRHHIRRQALKRHNR